MAHFSGEIPNQSFRVVDSSCNGCESIISIIEEFYRNATPEFRQKKVNEQIKKLNEQCQTNLVCLPKLRIGL